MELENVTLTRHWVALDVRRGGVVEHVTARLDMVATWRGAPVRFGAEATRYRVAESSGGYLTEWRPLVTERRDPDRSYGTLPMNDALRRAAWSALAREAPPLLEGPGFDQDYARGLARGILELVRTSAVPARDIADAIAHGGNLEALEALPGLVVCLGTVRGAYQLVTDAREELDALIRDK